MSRSGSGTGVTAGSPRRVLSLLALVGAMLGCRVLSPPLTFSPAELPEAQVGQSYKVTIAVSGNRTPVFFISVEEGDLPEGLALYYEEGSSTAEIRGVPSEAGEYEFTVTAWCRGTNVSGQVGEHRYRLVVR